MADSMSNFSPNFKLIILLTKNVIVFVILVRSHGSWQRCTNFLWWWPKVMLLYYSFFYKNSILYPISIIVCVDGHFGYNICFLWICMKKESMCNHQSSRDWNDLEVASASRIKPDVKGTFQDCSISILDVTASIPTHEIPGFELK